MKTQQIFLRSAMQDMGASPDDFCIRIGCTRKTLDRWLLPSDDKLYAPMDDGVWALVREIQSYSKSKAKAPVYTLLARA
jgi:hypothetical protein